jgi:hypothetical protein
LRAYLMIPVDGGLTCAYPLLVDAAVGAEC